MNGPAVGQASGAGAVEGPAPGAAAPAGATAGAAAASSYLESVSRPAPLGSPEASPEGLRPPARALAWAAGAGAGVLVGGASVLGGGSVLSGVLAATCAGAAAWLFAELRRARRVGDARVAEARAQLAEAAPGCLWTWGPGSQAWFADAWPRTFGVPAGNARGLTAWLDRVHPEDVGALTHALEQVRAGAQRSVRRTYRVERRDEWRSMEVYAVAIDTPRGVVLAGTADDVSVRQQLHERLSHSAFHDPLTGLPNRALFLDRLGHCHGRARRNPQYHFAVVFLDIDDFKVINDSLGHPVGDELLAVVAQRLLGAVRPGDTVARIGGDEFTVLLEPAASAAEAERVADRLREAIVGPLEVRGHTVQVSTSVGVAFSNPDYSEPLMLLRDADTAMYEAKREGPGRQRLFDRAMHDSAMRRLRVESELRRGLEARALMVYYQPIVSLRTGRIEGFEALVRLRGESGAFISPGEFIPLAEGLGLIDVVLDRVLEDAARQLAAWQALHPHVYVSVNVSGRSLRAGLVERLTGALARHGVAAGRLKLELTESVLVSTSPQAAQQLLTLRDLGFGLYIDDFGTGYSSLAYLHQFPVDHIKLDRSFVMALDGVRMPDIVETILTLSRRLGAAVIAEGIETEGQLAALRGLGCMIGQGYLFSPAVPAPAATALLDSGRAYEVSPLQPSLALRAADPGN